MSERQATPTRERIVRSAAKLFLARSYAAVGVNEICEVAHAQKGSFYHFFATKSDLAIAVIDHHATAMWALHEELEAEARGPLERMRTTADVVAVAQTRLFTAFGRVVGCPLGNLAVELTATDDPAGLHVSIIFEEWEGRVRRHCRDAAAANQLTRQTDPDKLARLILATMQGMILLAKATKSGPEDIPVAINRVIDASVRVGAVA